MKNFSGVCLSGRGRKAPESVPHEPSGAHSIFIWVSNIGTEGAARRIYHPWPRSRPFPCPRVHPTAPLATIPALSLPKGPLHGTLGHDSGPFPAQWSTPRHPWPRFWPFPCPRVHPAAPLGTMSALFWKWQGARRAPWGRCSPQRPAAGGDYSGGGAIILQSELCGPEIDFSRPETGVLKPFWPEIDFSRPDTVIEMPFWPEIAVSRPEIIIIVVCPGIYNILLFL